MEAFKKYVWTAEKESYLIDLIQEKPALWNPTDINYNKKSYKKLLYGAVGSEMATRWPEDAAVFKPAFIQAKFGSIRSYFQREERKLNCRPEGMGALQPKWVHYNRLLFLKDCSAVGSSESNLDSSCIEDLPPALPETECLIKTEVDSTSDEEATSVEDQAVEDSNQIPPDNHYPVFPGPNKKKRRQTEGEELIAAATSALQKLGTSVPTSSASPLHISIGQVVTHTLGILKEEEEKKFRAELFALLAKYNSVPEK